MSVATALWELGSNHQRGRHEICYGDLRLTILPLEGTPAAEGGYGFTAWERKGSRWALLLAGTVRSPRELAITFCLQSAALGTLESLVATREPAA